MEFTFETVYDQKALTAMAKGLRKTVRRKQSRRSHILGWIVIILAFLLAFFAGPFDFRAAITLIAALVMLMVLIFEDFLNGFFARKRMLPGTDKAFSHFTEESYSSETEIARTEFQYTAISAIAETNDYFIFLLGNNYAQVYNKRTILDGSIDTFRTFIKEKTQKAVCRI